MPKDTEHPRVEEVTVYGSAILLGAGGSTLLVTSLSMVADLIGNTVVRCTHCTYNAYMLCSKHYTLQGSAGFVYGVMSFTDKVSNGVAIQIVQLLHPCKSTSP